MHLAGQHSGLIMCSIWFNVIRYNSTCINSFISPFSKSSVHIKVFYLLLLRVGNILLIYTAYSEEKVQASTILRLDNNLLPLL